ncbi:MAG: AAA family ATPase [Chloroflexi bacterium]|nr:AAA family ATPase [Chloroflexota bacterium]
MASERMQRRIERLLEQIDQAEAQGEWQAVQSLAQDVLEIDPDNGEVAAYLRTAERRLAATSEGAGVSPASPTPVQPPATAPEAERRQLTVMFCDLQGSTALSQQLDPEVLRDVIRGYQEVCAGAVSRFEGHIAKYLGDGLLVYFGYPQAHEDDPQRAVRAGLAILEDMVALNTQLRSEKDLELTVRIGIHTGLVVAGEMGGGDTLEELAIVGETPNIAARIEGAALPNSVVVSNITANLIQGFFHYETLGPHELKGISEPVELFRVLEESGAQTRFDVAAANELTPLVGRDQELGLLLDRWEQAQEGLGQVVLLGGEAGIGKSRLIEALTERLTEETHTLWHFRCSAYHQNSALHPIIELLYRWLGFHRNDSSVEKLAKLESALAAKRVGLNDGVPLLASLLSLPVNGLYPPIQTSPEGQKELTREILVQLLMETDDQQPVLLVVEDLHWADPTTLELISLLIDQAPTAQVLAMFTFRPEFTPPWGSRSHLTQITLNRLPRRLATDMMAALTGGKEFPEEIVTQIATKSDGVPLFMEELTRMVVESGLIREVNGRYELSGPLPALAIPSTLQDSLTARLDRLSAVRETVQLAAVLGREFSHELIRAVSPMDDAILAQHLEQLVTSEFLFRRGVPPEANYSFKHALIRDAAYNSLLISRRQQYHQQTAVVLGERFADTMDAQPELLAHHYFEAGLTEQAVSSWLQAGEQELSRYAWEEALAHVQLALNAKNVDSGGSEPAEDAETAGLLYVLGRAQAATLQRLEMGQANLNLARAFDYYASVGDTARIVTIGELSLPQLSELGAQSGRLVARALELVPKDSEAAGRLHAFHGNVQGLTDGDYKSARESFDRALVIARRDGNADLEMRTLAFAAQVEMWHLNFTESLKSSHRAIELAVAASDPRVEVNARYWASMHSRTVGDSEEAQRQALEILAPAEKLRDRNSLSTAFNAVGWPLTLQGDWELAREFIQRGLDVSPLDPRTLLHGVALETQTGDQNQAEFYLEKLQGVVLQSEPGPSTANASLAIVSPLASWILGAAGRPDLVESSISAVLSSPIATPLFSTWARAGASLLAVMNDDFEAACDHYTAMKAWTGSMALCVNIDRILGLLAGTMGELVQGMAHFEDALAFCRKAGYRPELAWTCCDYAGLLLDRDVEGDRTKAVTLLEESLAISTELGMRPLMERVQVRLVTLSR